MISNDFVFVETSMILRAVHTVGTVIISIEIHVYMGTKSCDFCLIFAFLTSNDVRIINLDSNPPYSSGP